MDDDTQIQEFDKINKSAIRDLKKMKSSFCEDETYRTNEVGKKIAASQRLEKFDEELFKKEFDRIRKKEIKERKTSNVKRTIRIREEIEEYVLDRKEPIFERFHTPRENEGLGTKIRYVVEDHQKFKAIYERHMKKLGRHLAACMNKFKKLSKDRISQEYITQEMQNEITLLKTVYNLFEYEDAEIIRYLGQEKLDYLKLFLRWFK